MQLNRKKIANNAKPKSIRSKLTKATCLLLGTPLASVSPVQASEFAPAKWDFDSAILYYSEQNRVTAIEPVISAKQNLKNDNTFSVKLTLDLLSGASPNGAVPSNQSQTFSSPSGTNSYTIAPNETPLDPTFQDTRFAANLTWDTSLSRSLRRISGINFSSETDYLSLGLSNTFTYDINQKNTTLAAGLAINSDRIAPVGGKHDALVAVTTNTGGGGEDEEGGEGGEGLEAFLNGESKLTTDVLLGVTQILSRQTLMQLNYNVGKVTGYLNDPYKLVSVVNSAGDLVTSNPYYYEKRPDSRTKQSLYWKMNHQFSEDVVYLSYRYFWDDWDVKSHTFDLHYRFQVGRHTYLQPHYRFYQQSAASFYRYFLSTDGSGNPILPDYVSADYRLGAMTSVTAGILYGAEIGKESEFNFRVEYLKQVGEGHPQEAIGTLKNYDLFPDVKALILQMNYSVKF